MQLSDEQRQAIQAGGGLVVVDSGAGTGKTTVLTRRIVDLIQRGMDPRSIAAFTFTRDAAGEMRSRLEALLPADTARAVRMSTLHSCAARIVKRFPEAVGMHNGFRISSEGELTQALYDIAGELKLLTFSASASEDAGLIGDLRRAFSIWQENGMSGDMALDVTDEACGDTDPRWFRAYARYQEMKKERGFADFGDLTMLAVRILEIPGLREEVTRDFAWVMIDEAQDLNAIQARFVRLLTSRYNNLFLVGDEDQSLYSFRGAVPNLFGSVEALFPEAAAKGVTRVSLVINRRCTEEMLRPAVKAVSYNKRAKPKVLSSGRHGAPVAVIGSASAKQHDKSIAQAIRALHDKGVSYGDIAILGRASQVLDGLEAPLISAGVDYVMHTGERFIKRQEVTDILNYLKLASNPRDVTAFRSTVNRPARRIGATVIESVVEAMQRNDLGAPEAIRMLAESKRVTKNVTALLEYAEQLDTLVAARDGEAPASAVVDFIFNRIGYVTWAKGLRSAPQTLPHTLHALEQMAQCSETLETLMVDINTSRNNEFPLETSVYVGTLHGSKGREWPHVFLVGVERDVLPHRLSMANGRSSQTMAGLSSWDISNRGNVEEERRLFHVGLTRARETCTVSFAHSRGVGKMARASHPSSFFYEASIPVPKVKLPFSMKR